MRNRKAIWIVLLLAVGISGIAVMEGVVNPALEEKAARHREAQRNPLTHDFATVLGYHSKYMGDISNLAELNNHLPLGFAPRTYELRPEERTAEIHFEGTEAASDERTWKQNVLYHAAANFSLIDNLRQLEFYLGDSKYTVTRSGVETWHGGELSALRDEETWKREVKSRLSNDNEVDAFYKQYVIVEPITDRSA